MEESPYTSPTPTKQGQPKCSLPPSKLASATYTQGLVQSITFTAIPGNRIRVSVVATGTAAEVAQLQQRVAAHATFLPGEVSYREVFKRLRATLRTANPLARFMDRPVAG